MALKRFGTAFVPAALAAIALLASPASSLADCAMPPDLKTAIQSSDIVFVGKVTGTTNRDSWATVSVGEIWRGPDQPAELVIKGGPAGNAATSVDRTFEVGVTYLFFPYLDPTAGLSDNSCTATTPWMQEYDDLRPSGAHAPLGASTSSGFDFSGILGPIAVAVAVSGVLLAIGLLARSRQAG
jgi:hypothetical protein